MKPARIFGLSPSAFKTALRRAGHKVPRDFYARGCVTERAGRRYRWRWWSAEPAVDVSCPVGEFDRWANSVDYHIPFEDV